MRRSNLYTFVFITIVTIICAGLLSSAAYYLKDKQQTNVEVDMKKNILKAVKLLESNKISQQEILSSYNQNIESYAVNYLGEIIELPEGISVEDIDPEKEEIKPESERMYPVYVKKSGMDVDAYCIPIIGKGLWSTMYGYLALESDLNTILGITFYKQGETPGLGSEVESKKFQDKFIGKKIWDENNNLISINILKIEPSSDSPDLIHEVAGISGATKTSEGVMNLLLKDLNKYENYFRRLRESSSKKEITSNV
ncbi:MAG: NADH:ubiquinone reductase (Na(+)-transporting) subunit C [Candidatus Cloacimonadota bacterium]|nr:MAG: NADH:ubiquinone reductase (Na(+)-transporting) subunit C [Candidatus Cloacimonadota bacterium]